MYSGVEVARFRFLRIAIPVIRDNLEEFEPELESKRNCFPIPIPHFMNRQKEPRFTIPKFEESSHLYSGVQKKCARGWCRAALSTGGAGSTSRASYVRVYFWSRKCVKNAALLPHRLRVTHFRILQKYTYLAWTRTSPIAKSRTIIVPEVLPNVAIVFSPLRGPCEKAKSLIKRQGKIERSWQA